MIGATGVGAGACCADAIGAPSAITSAAQLPVIAMRRFQVEMRMRAPRVRESGCRRHTLIDFCANPMGAMFGFGKDHAERPHVERAFR